MSNQSKESQKTQQAGIPQNNPQPKKNEDELKKREDELKAREDKLKEGQEALKKDRDELSELEEKVRLKELELAEPEPAPPGKVDINEYNRYTYLKFVVFDGGKLKDKYKEELEILEEKLKNSEGIRGRKTITRAIGTHKIRIVDGIPLPDEYVKILKDAGRLGTDKSGKYKDCG